MADGLPTGAPPIPPQLLAALQTRGPGAVPMPGAAPTAVPGMPAANPAAALAQRDQGGMGGGQMGMLMFLAGMGFPVFMSTLEKAKPKPPSHKKGEGGGLPADAARAPQQAVNPQLAAMLAQRLAAQRGAMPGGGMPPGVPPMPAGVMG